MNVRECGRSSLRVLLHAAPADRLLAVTTVGGNADVDLAWLRGAVLRTGQEVGAHIRRQRQIAFAVGRGVDERGGASAFRNYARAGLHARDRSGEYPTGSVLT